MASDQTKDKMEHQDQSIKDRKNQLFEGPKSDVDEAVGLRKSFKQHVLEAPHGPMSSGVKATLVAVAVLVVLLLLAALFVDSGKKRKRSPAALPPQRPAAVAWRG